MGRLNRLSSMIKLTSFFGFFSLNPLDFDYLLSQPLCRGLFKGMRDRDAYHRYAFIPPAFDATSLILVIFLPPNHSIECESQFVDNSY